MFTYINPCHIHEADELGFILTFSDTKGQEALLLSDTEDLETLKERFPSTEYKSYWVNELYQAIPKGLYSFESKDLWTHEQQGKDVIIPLSYRSTAKEVEKYFNLKLEYTLEWDNTVLEIQAPLSKRAGFSIKLFPQRVIIIYINEADTRAFQGSTFEEARVELYKHLGLNSQATISKM